MCLMLTAQIIAALVGFHLTTPSKALLDVVLIDQLVAYLCALSSVKSNAKCQGELQGSVHHEAA